MCSLALASQVVIPTQPCFLYYLNNVNGDLTGSTGNGATVQLGNSTPSNNVLIKAVDQTNSVSGGALTGIYHLSFRNVREF